MEVGERSGGGGWAGSGDGDASGHGWQTQLAAAAAARLVLSAPCEARRGNECDRKRHPQTKRQGRGGNGGGLCGCVKVDGTVNLLVALKGFGRSSYYAVGTPVL